MTQRPKADAGTRNADDSVRIPGLVLIASAIAMVVLLALHPEGNAKDFAGMLQDEAANRSIDAFVHGGFIVVMAIQIACYAIFSSRLLRTANASIAGLVMFCFGATLLSGSTLIDGLALPAIAAKYVGIPTKIESARLLYVFGGTLISILMPLGIGFQSAGIVGWSADLLRTGRRIAGLAGLVLGLAILASTIAATFTKNPMALMAGIAGLAFWAAIAGITMFIAGRSVSS
jgi:hypothetical protein